MRLLSKLVTKQSSVSRSMLYFVAFLYSVSTGQVSATELINVARSSDYAHYSRAMRDIYVLGITWRYNLAHACELVAAKFLAKDLAFNQLLMKFAQIIRLGENLSHFLKQELEVTIQAYKTYYEKQLESIKLMTGLYSTMMSTAIFMIAASIIMGIFSGSADSNMMMMSIFASPAGLGAFVFLMYKGFPRDEIVYENASIAKGYRLFAYPCIASSAGIAVLLITTDILGSKLLALAVAALPLLALGYYARRIENRVYILNYWYPAFVRYFGEIYSTIGSLRNTLRTALKSDFGPLNQHLRALLNRVENKVSAEDAFEQLSSETANRIIADTNTIIVRGLHKGANMGTVGFTIANIVTVLNELYNRRLQIAKVFDMTLLILHVLSLATLSLMATLTQIFSRLFSSKEVQMIMPLTVVDPALLQTLLPVIVVVISIINALAGKIARGGYFKTVWFNLGLYISIGAATMYTTDIFMSKLMDLVMNIDPTSILG
ncbi:MAG: hypothetical protein NZ517_03620 [Candidatus Nitrosocaldus sp.]|nr:hypothetical protein [Candidatus Nitrosocaldus sp.]